MRVFHQNESCLACPHPPSSYEGGRDQVGSSHFDEKLHFDRTLRYDLIVTVESLSDWSSRFFHQASFRWYLKVFYRRDLLSQTAQGQAVAVALGL